MLDHLAHNCKCLLALDGPIEVLGRYFSANDHSRHNVVRAKISPRHAKDLTHRSVADLVQVSPCAKLNVRLQCHLPEFIKCPAHSTNDGFHTHATLLEQGHR